MLPISKLKEKYSTGLINKKDFIENAFEVHKILLDYVDALQNTDIESIDIQQNNIIITTKREHIKFFCDHPDMRAAPFEIINFNHYELEESNFFRKILKKDDIIFDIGANIGWFSLVALKQQPSALVFAFEPIPLVFENLKKNIEINSYLDSVKAYNLGLSDFNGEQVFFFDKNFSSKSSRENIINTNNINEINVSISTLDKFVQTNSVKKLDIIKCDVEGGELMVFKGGIQSISQYKPVIITEILRKWSAKFNYNPNEILDLLFGIGYGCFVLQNDNIKEVFLIDESTQETNFVFLHKKNHIDIMKKYINS